MRGLVFIAACLAGAGCSVIVDNNLQEPGSCSANSDCDDAEPCNGIETCSGDGMCEPDMNPLPDGTACQRPGTTGSGLICLDGSCDLSRCGDQYVDPMRGETCDDGNSNNRDGCTDECMPSCMNDVDCDDGDPCDGMETCSPTNGCLEATMCLAPTTACRTPANEPGQCGDCKCEAR